MDNIVKPNHGCTAKEGALRHCAPLAMSYVPPQQNAEDAYDPNMALARGTLFPGLDLPFMNVVNKGKLTGTPLGELMALDFVIKELNLYLDTHKEDQEALALYRNYIKLAKDGRKRYEEVYGPLQVDDAGETGGWNWLNSPWPWEYEGGRK